MPQLKGQRTRPGYSFTVTQNFTLVGCTAAELSAVSLSLSLSLSYGS